MTLIDSCVLIDMSRGRDAALHFIRGLPQPPAISVLSATEVLAGVRSRQEAQYFEAVFADWNVVAVDMNVARLAGDWLGAYRASHGLDIVDATIAASAKVHELPLATLNLKHFPMFDGLQRPY